MGGPFVPVILLRVDETFLGEYRDGTEDAAPAVVEIGRNLRNCVIAFDGDQNFELDASEHAVT